MMQKKFKANRPKVIGNTNITPYWQVIEKIIDESDVILEILDARMPWLSRNEELEKMIKEKNKKLIFILNKSDLVSGKVVERHKKLLKKESDCYALSATKKATVAKLRGSLFMLAKDSQFFKIGVVGYPNTGKSSLINSLVKRKKAPVSSKAGTTHGIQWIKLSENVRIMDSPGILPLKKQDEVRYALIGSRNPEKIKNLDVVAYKIIELFEDSDFLNKKYNIDPEIKDAGEIIEAIGRKKGYLKRGNEIDDARVAITIIRDWQKGKLKL